MRHLHSGLIGLTIAALAAPGMAPGQVRRYPMPAPRYEVRLERSVMVPARDGVRLSTDLYFPRGIEGALPVILQRSPYNKSRPSSVAAARFFAGQGFVAAIQDTRGRYESEGEFVVQGRDEQDGYDTVEWLAVQPWSSGKIGTYGCSYVGDTQMMLARARPPHLAAQIPQAAGSSAAAIGGRYHNFGVFFGGAFELAAGLGWFWDWGTKYFYRPPPHMPRERWLEAVQFYDPAMHPPEFKMNLWWDSLPTRDILRKAGHPATDYETIVALTPTDPWWEQFGYLKDTDRFNAPALHINSWYDFGPQETFVEFNGFRTGADNAAARDNQFVIISPTTHCRSESTTEHTVVGVRDLGDAQFDHWGTYLRWYEHWLKGIDNDVTRMPKVQIYVLGRNVWRGENEWPLARTKWTKYYLHSGGGANGRLGDGTLSTMTPTGEPVDRYTYDPRTPAPTVGGSVCAACTPGQQVPDGPADQREVEMRQDLLVFTSPAFEQGLEVTGPLSLVLYLSSDARDTDLTGKLVDVYPDGTAYNIQEGILRVRYREGYNRKVLMKPDSVYQVRVDLEATSNYFAPGHRIRVDVSSSNFPRWDRNLNTGGNNFDETRWVVAHNVIHHSAKYPSHVLLPVIP